MICDVNATLEEKTAAIQNRTPDQKMERAGVPVSIGGEVFELKPLVRKQARVVRAAVKEWIARIDKAAARKDADPMEALDLTDDAYAAVMLLAIPELAGREDWLDEHATSEELSDAFQLAMVFVNPNRTGAQTPGNGAATATSGSPTSTPSSASSTPPTPLQPLTSSSPMSK